MLFRINTFEISLPSLRQRSVDVPVLAKFLAQRFPKPAPKSTEVFTPAALARLVDYHWPGNVRELANVVEHASILCDQWPIDIEHLPERFQEAPVRSILKMNGPRTLVEIEIQAIHEAIERNNGNKPLAAKELDISLKTLYNKFNADQQLEKSA